MHTGVCIVIMSTMGNTMVVIVVYKGRRMRTTSNFLIVSMAVSDCLCTVMVIPKLITQIFTYPAAWLITGAVGNFLCLIITVAVSLLNLMIAIGVGKSLNGREKNSDEEKSRTQRRAPWDKVLTNQFQTVTVILASDWCQKAYVFSAQSQSSKTRSSLASSYTIDTSRPVARHFLLEEESSNHSTKYRADRSAYPQGI